MAVNINSTSTKQYQPFIKWVGGKRGLLSQLLEKFPQDFENYHEPFLGGGAVFFELFSKGLLNQKNVYLSDINSELINAYQIVKKKPTQLIKNLETLKRSHNKEFYYEMRELDRKDSFKQLSAIERAARFIYLNKTCFNGLYRVNKKGFFNTPIGSYTNPNIADKDTILSASEALQGVTLSIMSFDRVINNANQNDLIYFDPPYYPLTKTSNFTSYHENEFLDDKQNELFNIYKNLDDMGCKLIQSNSNTEFIYNLYNEYHFLDIVMANRTINSNANKRQKIKELVITNYN